MWKYLMLTMFGVLWRNVSAVHADDKEIILWAKLYYESNLVSKLCSIVCVAILRFIDQP